MSQQDAVKFLRASASDPKLADTLSKAPRTLAGWLRVAVDAGFQVTPDDMKAVAEKLLGGKIAGDPVEALTSKDGAELSDEQLAAVAGGAGASAKIGLSANLVSRLRGNSMDQEFPDQWIRAGSGGMGGGKL